VEAKKSMSTINHATAQAHQQESDLTTAVFPDNTYAKQVLEILIGAAPDFLDKADRVNCADLARQDDDNPESTPLGEEAIRAENLLGEALDLQRRVECTPPTSDEAVVELEAEVLRLVDEAEEIGISMHIPGVTRLKYKPTLDDDDCCQ
jgi:hypothetical protein